MICGSALEGGVCGGTTIRPMIARRGGGISIAEVLSLSLEIEKELLPYLFPTVVVGSYGSLWFALLCAVALWIGLCCWFAAYDT